MSAGCIPIALAVGGPASIIQVRGHVSGIALAVGGAASIIQVRVHVSGIALAVGGRPASFR